MAGLMLALSAAAHAQEPPQDLPDAFPPIRGIAFEGNDTTQPKTMLREMSVRVGDPADPLLVERSRQAVLDLGLFKAVNVRQEPLADGVRLTFKVEEKWYIVPIPRYSVNSDGKDSYGFSLNWFNVAGLNHSMRAHWSNSDEQKVNKGRSTSYRLGYAMPFAFDSPYNASFSAGHSRTPIIGTPDYVETFDSAQVAMSRTFGTEVSPSQGWTLGSSVSWSNQDTEGMLAPARYGAATALGLHSGYRDVRFRVFSEEGVAYGADLFSADEGALSDYGYNQISARYARFLALGDTPHQNLHLYANAGSYHGGPQGVESDAGVFSLGGASALRGYGPDTFVGDAYYYLGAEYLRPVFRNWLRVVVIAEAGQTFADAHSAHLNKLNASVGVGLRIRFKALVNFEVEAGMAWPLEGGGARFFASRV